MNTLSAFAGPNRTTYQAKIVKPDGYPLESSSVNFKFTILDPAGSCILYAETYSSVNMSSTGGLISFSLGSGVKTYPVSATTFEQVFSNITPTLSCDAGGPPSYSPASSDARKIVMQFHDGAGWQTLPAMSINAVPYAMYASEASSLNGKTDADFVELASVPACLTTEALRYNGTSFSCVNTATVSAAAVVSALGYTPADAVSVTALSSSLSTTDSTVAAVSSSVFSVAANVASVSSSVFAVSSTVSSLASTVTSFQSTVAASFAAITSSQWSSSGTTVFYNSGNVGIGTTTPASKFHVGVAPTATANYGTLSLGSGAFNGSTAGFFTGPASGTSLAVNEASGFAGNFIDLQANGVSKFRIAGNGDLNLGTTAYTTRSVWLTTGNQAKLELNAGGVGQEHQAARLMMGGHNGFGANFHVYYGSSADVVNGDFRIYDYHGSATPTERFRVNNVGNVGIGTTAPVTKLEVSGGVRISMEAAVCAVSYAGTLRYNSGLVEYCNGTSWSAFGVAGAGITLFNGSSSGTQTFVTGITGTNFNVTTNNGVHSFNIPLAASAAVTAGLLSNADYTTFNAKMNATSAAVISAMGYTPANSSTVATLTSNLNTVSSTVSSLTSNTAASFAAITSSQWVTSGSTINYSAGNVGIGTVTPELPLHVKGTGIRLENSAGSQKWGVGYTGATDFTVYDATAGTERIVVKSSTGNVGIGNSSPQSVLSIGSTLGSGYALTANSTSAYGMVLQTSEVSAGNNAAFWVRTSADSGATNKTLFRVQNNGQVGLGINAPTAYLHLTSGSTTAATAPLKFTSGTLMTAPEAGAIEYDGTYFYVTDGANSRKAILTDTGGNYSVSNLSSSGNITFLPNSSVIVSSTAASTNSSTGALIVNGGLGVAGNINAGGNITTTANIQGASVTATSGIISPYIAGGVASAGNITIDSTTNAGKGNIYLAPNGGKVGIGYNSPSGKLHIGGSLSGAYRSWMDNGLLVGKSGDSDGGYFGLKDEGVNRQDTVIAWGDDAADTLRFIHTASGGASDGVEVMRMTPAGNVGIGVINPTQPLTTSGNVLVGANQYPALFIRDTSWWMGILRQAQTSWPDADSFVFSTPTGRPFVFQSGAASQTEGVARMYIDTNNGHVGIGTTTPSTLNGWESVLDVHGSHDSKIVATQSSTTTAVQTGLYAHALEANGYGGYPMSYGGVGFVGTHTDHDLGIMANNMTRIHVGKTGNVGVGTVTPVERLDVSGSIHVRGQNVFMVHDGAANANNDYMIYDDAAVLGAGGVFAFNADATRSVAWTGATGAIAAKAGYFVSNVSIGTPATTRTLEVNGSINAGGMVAETFTFAIDGTANGTWAIGSLSNNGTVVHATFELYVHNNSTIDALKFQVSLPTYSNGTFYSGWQELPVAFGSSAWNGQKNYVVDVLRSSASSGNPIYFRVRNKNGNGSSSTMKVRMTYNSDQTFTRITHVDTVATAFNAGTNAAGGPVDGMYGALEYSFPVAAGQGWRPADNTGLFIKNSGYVGIGTSTPSEMLEVSGSVKAIAYLYTSDRRLKKDIITLPDALANVLKLRGVNFVWKNNNEKTVGFIAQEVEAVYPELVKTDKVSGYKAVQYGNIVAILVEAIKQENKERLEAQNRCEAQIANVQRSVANVSDKSDARINQLEKENQELKSRLEKIEKFLNEKVK